MEWLEPRLPLDSLGAAVIGQTPLQLEAHGGALNALTVTFDEAIDVSTFTADDAQLKNPQGQGIVPITVTPVADSGQTQFELSFPSQNIRGDYRLTVGPDITDAAGNLMNQNRDGLNGEAEDVYRATVSYLAAASPLAAAPELFVEDFEAFPAAGSYWSFHTVEHGTVAAASASDPRSGMQHLQFVSGSVSTLTNQWATLVIDLSSEAIADDLTLDFWVRRSGNLTQHRSLFHVELSEDDTQWHSIVATDPPVEYVNYTVDLDQVAQKHSVALDERVYLRFRYYGFVGSYTPYLDDVRIIKGDKQGPQVVVHDPVEVASSSAPLDKLTVTFDETIDASTFTADDAQLKSPQGQRIVPITVTPVADSGQTRFELSFPPQNVRGTYRLTVGPNISDAAGNLMNQDQNSISGQPNDSYTGDVAFAPTIWSPATAPPSPLYGEGFEAWSPPPTYWSTTSTATGTVQAVTSDFPHSGTHHLQFSNSGNQWTTMLVDLSSHAAFTDLFVDFWVKRNYSTGNGQFYVELSGNSRDWHTMLSTDPPSDYTNYVLDLDQVARDHGVALDENVYVRFRHNSTSPTLSLDDVHIVQGDKRGPQVVVHDPIEVARDSAPLGKLTVTFDEAIDVSTFTAEDVELKSPQGQGIAPITVTSAADSGQTRFELSFPPQNVRGTYRLTVGPNIADAAGNLLNQDRDAVNGELEDAYRAMVSYLAAASPLAGPPELFVEDFESFPAAGSYWSFHSIGEGTVVATSDDNPHSGVQHLQFNSLDRPSPVNQSATLLVNLSGQVGVDDLTLDFWTRRVSRNTANQFFVELSGDGSDWNTILSTDPPPEYTNYTFDIDELATNGGVVLDERVYIRFRLSGPAGLYTAFLDDVRIVKGDLGGPALAITLDPVAVSEAAGEVLGTVTRINTDNQDAELVINLTTNDPTEATVPETVVIPSGQSSQTFVVSVQDDTEIDGPQSTVVGATARQYFHATYVLTVLDDEPATLVTSISTNAISETMIGTAATLTVSRNRAVDRDLQVHLGSSDINRVWLPATVTMPAGETRIEVGLEGVNNPYADGDDTVTVIAEADGFVSAVSELTVLDDDTHKMRTISGKFVGPIAEGVYYVTATWQVPQGTTLTVSPGAELRFGRAVGLDVRGGLVAQGRSDKGVQFTSASTIPYPGDWRGISTARDLDATLALEHVSVSFATTAITTLSRPNISIRNSEVHDNAGNGITVFGVRGGANSALILDNIVRNNGQSGVLVRSSSSGGPRSGVSASATVTRNLIFDNVGSGILVSSSYGAGAGFANSAFAIANIHRNWLHSNLVGISVSSGAPSNVFGSAGARALIENNLVSQNREDGIRLDEGGRANTTAIVRSNTLAANDGAAIIHGAVNADILNNNIVANSAGIEARGETPSPANARFNNLYNNRDGNWVNYPHTFGNLHRTNPAGLLRDDQFNISEDPHFQGANDYHLLLTSPLINAGTTDGFFVFPEERSLDEDFDGDWRVGSPDIGFDEAPALAIRGQRFVFDEAAGQEAGSIVVTRNSADTIESVAVVLHVTGSNDLVLPDQVTIASGYRSVEVGVAAVDDEEVDGNQPSILTADSAGYLSSSQLLLSIDDETTSRAVPVDGVLSINSTTQGRQMTTFDMFNMGFAESVAVLPNGGFVVTWSHELGDESGIVAQIFDSSGQRSGNEIRVDDLSVERVRQPSIASNNTGQFVVAWWSGSRVLYRRFSLDGNPLNGAVEFGAGRDPSIALADDGQLTVSWWSNGAKFQRFDSQDKRIGGQLEGPNSGTRRPNPAVAMNKHGETVILWDAGGMLYATRLGRRGEVLDRNFEVGAGDYARVDINDLGEFVVIWSNRDGSLADIVGRWYFANGDPAGEPFLVNEEQAGNNWPQSVAMRNDGSFVVTWRDPGLNLSQFRAGGIRLADDVRLTGSFGRRDSGGHGSVSTNDSHDIVVAWWGSRPEDNEGVFAQRLRATAPTPRFSVSSFSPTSTGFVARFSNGFEASELNVYDTQESDVVFVSRTTGNVAGSVILEPQLGEITFIKSGGPLEPDTYTATLRSGTDGFRSSDGVLLDGDGNGTAAANFVGTFTVLPSSTSEVTIGVPDFVRGPGQDVNVPADVGLGIPISLSNGENVRSVDFRISYDAALLNITAVNVGTGIPNGATAQLDASTHGMASVSFSSPDDLPVGDITFVTLRASIPALSGDSTYTKLHMVDVHDVQVIDRNDDRLPVIEDDAIHLVAYLGDVSGNARINASDVSRVARFAALLDEGFTGFELVDPRLLGDISGNGRVNARDASLLAQFVALIEVPEIPPIPRQVVLAGVGVSFNPELPSVRRSPGAARNSFASAESRRQDNSAVSEWSSHIADLHRFDPQVIDRVMARLDESWYGDEELEVSFFPGNVESMDINDAFWHSDKD